MTLQDILHQKKLDAILLWGPPEIAAAAAYYPTGSLPVALLATRAGSLLLCPAGSAPTLPGTTVRTYADCSFPAQVFPAAECEAILHKELEGIGRLGISKNFAPALPWFAPRAELADITPEINMLMLQKPEAFVPLVAKASEYTQMGYERLRSGLRPGMTEFDMCALVETGYYKAAGTLLPCGGDYVSGPRTQQIGGPPTNRVLQKGDPVIIDIQVQLGAAGVDDCRTFFMGTPSDEMAAAYAAVEKTLDATAKILAPGVKACDVYHTANQCLVTQGYPALPHHAGHGIGYAWNEAPYFVPEETQPLLPGMIVTLEPGVYLNGFGVRIENNYYITASGAELITQTPWDITWATIHC